MWGVKKMFKFYFCLELKHSQKELIGIVACSNKSCLPYKGEFHMKNELNMDTNFSERKINGHRSSPNHIFHLSSNSMLKTYIRNSQIIRK